MENIQLEGKNNPYNGNFDNGNNDIPSCKNDNSRLRKNGMPSETEYFITLVS